MESTIQDTIAEVSSESRARSFYDFDGILVPYYPSQQVTVVTASGQEAVRDIPPAYITNLMTYRETGSIPALRNALLSMSKEALLDLIRNSAFKKYGWEAPIAVSQAVPSDYVYPDYAGGRIILNEFQALQSYVDADGDRGILLFSSDKSYCELIKFPITQQCLLLKVLDTPPMEKFYDFKKRDAKRVINDNPVKRIGVNVDEELQFYKEHKEVPVGLLTNAWNSFDLWASRQMKWEDKNNYIFNSYRDPESGKTQRALDIEDGGMKAVRKEGKEAVEAKILSYGAGRALAPYHAWALTSCSGVGRMRLDQLDWFDDCDLDALMNDIMNLNVDFRDVRPREDSEDSQPYFVEDGLLARLKHLGLVQWQEIRHTDPNMPPSVLFWLTSLRGEPVALTDVKREGGLSYMTMLAPVWDNLDLYDEDGELVKPALHKWVHPINHMQKVMMTFDTVIRPYTDGPISHYFPRNVEDWRNPKRAVKIANLFKTLTEYCGKYGDPCPATKERGLITPSRISTAIIKRTVVIDYGRELDHEQMYEVALEAREKCNFCLFAKGKSRRVRKYMLANEHGGTILDYDGNASLHRGAKGRSQLQRTLSEIKMRVAIVKMDTLNQILITPTGVDKQYSEKAFLPQVFNTYEAYENYLKGQNATAEEIPAVETVYETWQGELRKCWTIDPRYTIRVGKLVDMIGNKFMPRTYKQAFFKEAGFKDTVEVDLLFPINELVDKDAHHAFLEDAVEGELFLPDGTVTKCMFVERTFFRTGAASENVPPRWRNCAFKGIDSFPIWWRYKQIEETLEPRTWNTEFAKELQRVKNQLIRKLTGSIFD